MRTSDLLKETFIALASNKTKTLLNVLGIIIGISSVIVMTSIGRGAQESIKSSIQSVGSNLLVVTSGAQRGFGFGASGGRGSAQTITMSDAGVIQDSVSGINAVSVEVSNRYQVVSRGNNTNTQVIGTLPSYMITRNLNVAEGQFFSNAQVNSRARVAVIGPTVAIDLFGASSNIIGNTVRINSKTFRVIGVTEAKGGSGFNNPDEYVFIPITTAQGLFTGNEYVNSISIAAIDVDAMKRVQSDVEMVVRAEHKLADNEDNDFYIQNQSDIVETATSITGVFTALLASVAGISLLVGGIGIMNMMLTTVVERTREIGLRKAVGARATDISNQFLCEALFVCVLGGLVGIALGYGVAQILASLNIVQTSVSVGSIVLAFCVSAGVGVVFGYYPARRASKLNPITALRYE